VQPCARPGSGSIGHARARCPVRPAGAALRRARLRRAGAVARPRRYVAARADRIELRELRIDAAALAIECSRALLCEVDAELAPREGGGIAARAATLHLENVKLELKTLAPPSGPATARWRLDALAGLEGELRIHIDDAVWQLDADVTIPIRQGGIDFNRVAVEHVGPDSSMGLSPMGLYVDAPNGRHYLFVFDTTHVPGARFERRGLLGALVSDRGALALQPFVEAIAGGAAIGEAASHAQGLLARTRIEGTLRLGEGPVGSPHGGLHLAAGTPGHNRIEVASAGGGVLVLRTTALSATALHWGVPATG
jgi:hypothetical protein